jgi:hypothetical protein
MQAIKLLWLLGLPRIRRASITRKQAILAAVTARVLAVRGANRGDKGLSAMVEYYTGVAARLTQAASIPEDLTDNELDEVLNAKTSFNKEL